MIYRWIGLLKQMIGIFRDEYLLKNEIRIKQMYLYIKIYKTGITEIQKNIEDLY